MGTLKSMKRQLPLVSVLVALLCGVSVRTQVPQAPGGTFAGRWEFVVKTPASAAGSMEVPFFIVEITGGDASPSAKVIDSMSAAMLPVKIAEVAVKNGQLTLSVEMLSQKITFTGKRVGDHLEGTAISGNDPAPADWAAQSTTKDKMTVPTAAQMAANQKPDQKAYSAATSKPPADRVAALKQFLSDFPDSALKEQASLTLAQSYPASADKIAALKKFLTDFPKSTQAERANLDIALAAPAATDRAAGLRKFIADFPASRLKEQAEYQLTLTFTAPAEREAAQDQFIKDHPKSVYATQIYQSAFDTSLRAKPVNEARLSAAIDGLMAATPDRALPMPGGVTMNMRAGTLNNIADQLMKNDAMLDRALAVIQEAVTAAGDKEAVESRAMYTTTMGQVLFKLKRYDEAGEALKKAVAISGADGDGETQLFLGKYYEVKGDETSALNAYMKATELGSPMDTRASLEKLFVKKYGSLASLETKLDEIYLAKPKAFEAGHYTRAAGAKDAQRVVLAELFTGAECGPCVAADLSFDGLAERYDHNTVAVLVYHLHIPGPDPMTNVDTEARAKYYGFNSTPSVVFDGTAKQIGGGPASGASKVFTDYKAKVEARLSAKPLADLSGLKTKVSGQKITISGQAMLLPDAADRAGHATLHLVVVEDSVRYLGSNGVRFHSYVVRKLVGSPTGVVLQKTGSKVSESVETKSLSASLDAYLDEFVKKPYRGEPVAFKDRVDHLDAKKLLVVAFVQDDQTKEILQAGFVRK